MFSIDNRRLYAFKEAGLTSVPVFKLTLRQASNSFQQDKLTTFRDDTLGVGKKINIRN